MSLILLCLPPAWPQTQPRLELGFHTGTITAMAMDAAERFLVTASDDQTVRVWDLSSIIHQQPVQLRVLRLPDGGLQESRMFCAAITPDGATIAAGGAGSRSLYIFDRQSGRLLRRLSGLPHVIFHLAYSPDGRYLVAVLNEGGGVRIYRTSDYGLTGEDHEYRGSAYWAAFSPAFAKDGLIATGAEDLYVRLYRVRPDGRMQLIRRRIDGQKDPPVSVAFSPDGRQLAVSLEDSGGYPEVEVWDALTLANLYRAIPANAMGGVADSLAWSADGKFVYFGGTLAAGSPTSLVVRVGHGGRNEEFQTARACGEQTDCFITALLPLRDGTVMFASANRHGIGVLDAEWRVATFHPAPVASFRGLSDSDRFRLSQDGASLRFTYQQDGDEPAWFSVFPRTLVAGGSGPGSSGSPPDDKSVNVRGLGSDRVLANEKVLDLDGETGLRVAVIPGTHRYVIAGLWSLFLFDEAGQQKWQITLPAGPEALNVSPDGRFAVAALIDGTIRWFGLANGEERLSFFPDPDRKRWILWTPQGYYDCSAGAEDLLGFQTNRGEEQVPEFVAASALKAKFYSPETVTRALR